MVSNEVAFTDEYMENIRRFGRPNAAPVPEQIRGVLGHGTKMATIAAGKLDGIAPNANLHLLKIQGLWNSGETPRKPDKSGKIQPMAVLSAFDEVRRHVGARRSADPNTKSVINMSWGRSLIVMTRLFSFTDRTTGVQLLIDEDTKAPIGAGADIEAIFPEFQAWCESLEIPIVLAAGNDNTRFLHEQVPQKFGTPDNGIITVGGVEREGTLYQETTSAMPGEAGSMSVYAPARDVRVPSDGVDMHTGTSQAAAITVSIIPEPRYALLTSSAVWSYSLPLCCTRSRNYSP
jgi:hypothetical protein